MRFLNPLWYQNLENYWRGFSWLAPPKQQKIKVTVPSQDCLMRASFRYCEFGFCFIARQTSLWSSSSGQNVSAYRNHTTNNIKIKQFLCTQKPSASDTAMVRKQALSWQTWSSFRWPRGNGTECNDVSKWLDSFVIFCSISLYWCRRWLAIFKKRSKRKEIDVI